MNLKEIEEQNKLNTFKAMLKEFPKGMGYYSNVERKNFIMHINHFKYKASNFQMYKLINEYRQWEEARKTLLGE